MHRRRQARSLAVLAAGLALSVVSASGCRFETVEDENLEASVEATLARSADAWNAGDVDGFLGAFADAPSTTFIPNGGPVMDRAEFEAAVARVAGGTNGTLLRFDGVSVRPLPPLIGIVTGRFSFADGSGSAEIAGGWFTAVVRRVSDGWKIVHAHASWSRNG